MSEADRYGFDFPSDRGICDVCEKRPVVEGDCMCNACRQWVTDNTVKVVDPVELLLGHHRITPFSTLDKTQCSCGARWDGGPGHWRQHLATLIHTHFGSTYAPWVPAIAQAEAVE